MFKKILAVLLIMVIFTSSQAFAAEELDSPLYMTIATETYEDGNSEGDYYFSLKWKNPDSIIKLGSTVMYEVDFKEGNGPWKSETETKLKNNNLMWDGANISNVQFDPILEKYTNNKIDIKEKHYSFRIRYSFNGIQGDFSTIGLAGITNYYYNASSWAIPELDKALEFEFISNTIKHNMGTNITREEFAEVLMEMYEKTAGEPVSYSGTKFSDTKNLEVLKAAKLGIVIGNAYGQFEPKEFVTRQDICTMIYRAIKKLHPDLDFNVMDVARFADHNNIDQWAIEPMKFMYKNSILKGDGKGKIDPKGNSSREVATILILRTYEKFK